MAKNPASLWHHSDFLKLWLGTSVSLVGSQVTLLALPLSAVLILKATPTEMGSLGAAQFAPFLLLSLFAGVWVDRLPRRAILIWTDLGRFVLLGSIPVIAWLNLLSIWYLYAVSFLAGVLSVFFEVAAQSYLPDLVETEQLVEGNTKLEVSRSLAQIGGPGLAGFLVQLFTPPLAIIVDAVSFALSAVCSGLIKAESKPALPPNKGRRPLLSEVGEGLQTLFGNILTRSLIYCGTTRSFFSSMMTAVFTLYLVQDLKLDALTIGLITASGGIGTLIGAVLANQAARHFGLGHTLVGGALVVGLANLLTPAASGPALFASALLIASLFVSNLAAPFYGVNQLSLRQTITPPQMQGRVNATVRFMAWGALAVGSLAGGFLGQLLGLRLTLLIGAVGTLISFLWIFFSPVRQLKEQPAPAEV